MHAPHAQLSSISTAIEDLTRRVTGMADHYAATPREDLAGDLYEVERALRSAQRRLERVVRELG